MLELHRVSQPCLDRMAAGHTEPDFTAWLREANRSKQLALLRTVLEKAPTLAPLSEAQDAWNLLATAHTQNPAMVDPVLTDPQTGLWTTGILRRLRNPDAGSAVPLWAEFGRLHLMAASAAVRARLDFTLKIPAWHGTIMLPALGLVSLPGEQQWGHVEIQAVEGRALVQGASGQVILPDDLAADGPGWQALRRLDPGGWAVRFDDLSPYREFNTLRRPHRIPLKEVTQWQDSLRATREMLDDRHPLMAADIAESLRTLVPHGMSGQDTPFSASHHEAFGSVVLSHASDTTGFAEVLIHELQHSKLGVVLTLVDLLDFSEAETAPLLYAPWRDDPRPAIGVLHGVASFMAVTAFYREHRARTPDSAAGRRADFEFAYRREQARLATDVLSAEANLTAAGRRFVTIMRDTLHTWCTEPVPDAIRAAAEQANADHRLSWQVRHLDVSSDLLTPLAVAWLSGQQRPDMAKGSSKLRATIDPSPTSSARLALTRAWVADPEMFSHRSSWDAGAVKADWSLLAGDKSTAAELYLAEIAAQPSSVAAWAGLILATNDKTLARTPELIYALYHEIQRLTGRSVDPLRLAHWLAV